MADRPQTPHSVVPREGEARLKAILETAVEGIITIDERGRCESINPAAERMFGYSAHEVVGQNISMLMPEPYSSEHDGYLNSYLATGHRKIIGIGREAVGLHKSGRQFPIQLSVSEIKLERGRLFTGIVHDLTEQKEAERRLVQSERLAVLGEAMTRLAHESRNALQRIQIAVEVARLHGEGNDPLATQLDAIERANDALNALLEELRNYAAPLHLERKRSSLVTIWREAWSAVGFQRSDRDVEFAEETDDELLKCHADRFRLGQVFRNLFENALAACDDPVKIRVSGYPAQLEGNTAVRVVVADNGPGMDVEQRERIFEPFYTTKAKGTGLGMAIARRIVEAHGGTIAVEVSPLGGAALELVLPVEPPRAEKPVQSD
ncbi:PAS domain S-box protein [Aeoliella sp. ICT_H6.2]|uniref:Sensor protein FixL n=1 Tax=Aeoliella straminimaris TaxID=2954799 RepID=A0A9X2FAK0_9BACT|nr:PAS domain S-box protein [Aeoliella straminimaris]MCO6045437.1 PAS domain S-box protein [Aeoliella straminimaris]